MDEISLTELPRPSGISRNSPQPYEMTVSPTGVRMRPELDFLHEGDGITMDNVTYFVEFARQVRPEGERPYWTWVYRVAKEETATEEEWTF